MTPYAVGYAHAQWGHKRTTCIVGPVDLDDPRYQRIPYPDLFLLADHPDPDPRRYWQGFNDYFKKVGITETVQYLGEE